MMYLGDFPTGQTIYIPFHTFDSNGASVTMTGLAITDIEIYKNGGTTQRSSDNGYTLLDTDGTDFDGATGCHGISIDTSDNTDAGFYAAGSEYWVMINAVTIDSQTVRFWVAIFSIDNRMANTITDKVWDEVLTGATHNVNNSAGKKLRQAADVSGYSGTVNDASATTTSFIIDSGASAIDDFYIDQTFIFTDGALEGQARIILTYTGATRTVTFDEALTSAPANGDGIQIMADHVHSAAQIADNVLDEALAGHTTAGTLGKGVTDINTKTDNLPADPATETTLAIITDYVDELETRLTAARAGYLDNLNGHTPQSADHTAAIAAIPTTKTEYSLSTAGVLAIWHQALSAIVTAGTIGKLLKDEITSARMAVLTDLINGGRLNNILDAIKDVTDQQGSTIIEFTVDTVINTHTPTTTEFQADDITEATTDHYNGRLVIFTTGALLGQMTDITAYVAVGGIGQFTVTGMTEAPANNDTGIII
ncbi:MAG: hypothetical protein GY774_16580 [Planctomycetes bacterium]|nr:hypothetical protein [Planctomycetota bacterium]